MVFLWDTPMYTLKLVNRVDIESAIKLVQSRFHLVYQKDTQEKLPSNEENIYSIHH